MSDWKNALENEGFSRDDVELSEMYVSLVVNLLERDRRHAEPLRRGINELAVEMNSIVPEIEEGKMAGGITPEDLAPAMDPIPREVVFTFIEIAGTVMLASLDGPMGSAVSLKTVIEEVEERMDVG